MEENIIVKLQNNLNNKNNSYRLISKFILEQKNDKLLKIKEIKSRCFVSSSSITNFCQSLNFGGFSELKFAYMTELKKEEKIFTDTNTDINTDKLNGSYLKKLIISLENTSNLLSNQDLLIFLEYIHNYNNININSFGITSIVAKDLEMKLLKLGKKVTNHLEFNFQKEASKNANENTLVIGYSYTGTNKEVLNCLDISKKNGAKIVFITGNSQIVKEKNYDLNFIIDFSDSQRGFFTPTTSKINMLFFNDILFLKYMKKYKEETALLLKRNRI